MATIGLDKIYYAKITENASGEETYGTPASLAKAMKADLNINVDEAKLFADDGTDEVVREFKDGNISLGVKEVSKAVAKDLFGITVDSNGVAISASENVSPYVALAFRAKKADGKYQYYWLYKVKFSVPSESLQTKGDSITFSTPTLEGTILRRNKADSAGKHPWKADVCDGDSDVSATVITNWYNSVYEPDYTPRQFSITVGSTGQATVDVQEEAEEGETVTLLVESEDEVSSVKYVDAEGNEEECEALGENTYSFEMPASNVTINVETE